MTEDQELEQIETTTREAARVHLVRSADSAVMRADLAMATGRYFDAVDHFIRAAETIRAFLPDRAAIYTAKADHALVKFLEQERATVEQPVSA